ncbi:MAG TPA: ATP-binding protein [Blastocatellia bacterium]|nr:ATP-binding protein [Blastocatellia bacterium]
MLDRPVSDGPITDVTEGIGGEPLSSRLLKVIEAGHAAFRIHEADELLPLLRHQTRELLSCARANVWRKTNQGAEQTTTLPDETVRTPSIESRGFPGSYGYIVDKMWSSAAMVRSRDFASDRWFVSDTSEWPPLKSFLAAPMLEGGQVRAWLCVADKVGGTEFTSDDEVVLGALAAQAVATLANASCFNELTKPVNAPRIEASEREAGPAEARNIDAVSTFAARVAHDFNNWLTAIIGYSQMGLSKIGPGSPLKRELQQIERAGTRAASVTHKLLAFSGKQVLHPSIIGLNDVISKLARPISTIVGSTIQVVTDLDPGLQLIKADPDQLQQMIRDLISNARDAMTDGGKLVIRTSNQERSDLGGCVLLVVSDTGVGIDPDILPRIFDPFFTSRSKSGQAGFGLSTVHGFVRQSGGAIDVLSEPGAGTTFRIYFPRVQGVAQAREVAAEKATGNRTILVVDDEDLARGLVCEVLRGRGFEVLEARDGIEAFGICGNHQGAIDLMLIDLNMRDLNGNRLAQTLCRIRPSARVLSCGSIVETSDPDSEMYPSLAKPFTPDQLLNMIEEALTGGRRSIAGGKI